MVALITGASGGIGSATALAFAKAGYNVALHSSHRESSIAAAETLAEQCRALGVEALCVQADVSDYGECEAMVKAVKAQFGQLDVLVNNAGMTDDGLLLRMSEEAYDRVIAANQKSVFMLMKLAGAGMLRRKFGRIINFSSVSGIYGNAGQCSYCASKAAIIGMTKSAAKELGAKGITVNAIAPGFISTPMTDALTEEQRQAIIDRTTLRRAGTPGEVADLAVFLAGAGYITGQVIEISGGLSM